MICCHWTCFFLYVVVCVRAMRDPAAQVRQGLFCVVFLVCFAHHFVWHSTPSIECRHCCCCCCGERGRAAPQRGERDKDFNITKICSCRRCLGVGLWGDLQECCRGKVSAVDLPRSIQPEVGQTPWLSTFWVPFLKGYQNPTPGKPNFEHK